MDAPQSAPQGPKSRMTEQVGTYHPKIYATSKRIKTKQFWTEPITPGSCQITKSNLAKTWWQLLLSILSLGLLATIVLFVQSSNYAEEYSDRKLPLTGILKIDASTSLAILRTAQAILSTITSTCLGDAMELIQWATMNTPSRIPFSSLLALSSTTGKIAMTRLLFSDATGMPARLWTLLRYVQTGQTTFINSILCAG